MAEVTDVMLATLTNSFQDVIDRKFDVTIIDETSQVS